MCMGMDMYVTITCYVAVMLLFADWGSSLADDVGGCSATQSSPKTTKLQSSSASK